LRRPDALGAAPAEGRLTPELAERRIAMMRAIAERLEMGAPMLQSAAAHMAEKTK
jgi:hypothetical protein